MGTDTKGYVMTPVKNVMHVMTIVENVIHKMVREKMPAQRGMLPGEGFTYPSTRLSPDMNMAQVTFSIAGESRSLTVHFGCDNDAKHKHPGEKLILSMGLYGVSIRVVEAILKRLTHLGRCYLDRNDCDDEPDVEVTTAPMTFIDAIVQRYDCTLSVKHWMQNHAVFANGQSLQTYLGITSEELAQCKADNTAIYGICDTYRDAAKEARLLMCVGG
jgi:hypothetical protein